MWQRQLLIRNRNAEERVTSDLSTSMIQLLRLEIVSMLQFGVSNSFSLIHNDDSVIH